MLAAGGGSASPAAAASSAGLLDADAGLAGPGPLAEFLGAVAGGGDGAERSVLWPASGHVRRRIRLQRSDQLGAATRSSATAP